MQLDPHAPVRQVALEVARVAHEGLGSTQFERLRETFSQKIEQESDDQEVRLRSVTCLLLKKTRKGLQPKNTTDIHMAGLCFIWLANTRVSEWTVLQLYGWGASLPGLNEDKHE